MTQHRFYNVNPKPINTKEYSTLGSASWLKYKHWHLQFLKDCKEALYKIAFVNICLCIS